MSGDVIIKRPDSEEDEDVQRLQKFPGLRDFKVRTLTFFEDKIVRGFSDDVITIRPFEESLLYRIVVHKSIGKHFVSKLFRVGDDPPIARGSGSLEIFHHDVPNWTPERVVFSPNKPITIAIRNEQEKPLKIVGSVIAYRKLRKGEE